MKTHRYLFKLLAPTLVRVFLCQRAPIRAGRRTNWTGFRAWPRSHLQTLFIGWSFSRKPQCSMQRDRLASSKWAHMDTLTHARSGARLVFRCILNQKWTVAERFWCWSVFGRTLHALRVYYVHTCAPVGKFRSNRTSRDPCMCIRTPCAPRYWKLVQFERDQTPVCVSVHSAREITYA
jgi:hypothetical protein